MADVDILENKLGFKLPKLYREFLLKYEHGIDKLLLEEFYNTHRGENEIVGPVCFRHPKTGIFVGIGYFFDLDEVFDFWNSIDQYESTGTEIFILQIASLCTCPNGGLYVGFGENNRDQIYWVHWDGGDDWLIPITENINEFAQGLYQDYDNLDLRTELK